MKKILAALLIAAPLVAQAPVKWEENLDAALVRAKAEHKAVFLDLWAEWCGPCQKLKKDTFPSAQGAAALAKVVATSVMVETRDRTPNPHGMALAERFQLEAFPTLLMVDENGKELRRHVGYLAPAEFARFVEGK
ncbi:MAG TPA: thioredoxin fold domain-containing protein [Holophagaceae bacterium]|nr:thioredoxin fold domain-containing protein [Holophagaceae bacterium]